MLRFLLLDRSSRGGIISVFNVSDVLLSVTAALLYTVVTSGVGLPTFSGGSFMARIAKNLKRLRKGVVSEKLTLNLHSFRSETEQELLKLITVPSIYWLGSSIFQVGILASCFKSPEFWSTISLS